MQIVSNIRKSNPRCVRRVVAVNKVQKYVKTNGTFEEKYRICMLPYGFHGKIHILAGILLLLAFAGKSQAHPAPLAFDHLTVENGLSHSTVYTLLQDRYGLIWIGTRYGLNRYDGYDCKVFLPIVGDSTSLNGPTILTLLEDRQGKIWIGHREAGISIWDRSKGTFERFSPSKPTGIDWSRITVRSLYEDSRGRIWVGTLGGGAFVFDENRNPVEHLCMQCRPEAKALSGDFIFDFLEDGQGKVWIVTDGRGINAYDLKTRSNEIVNSPDSLNLNSYEKSLCLDEEGNLWVGTAGSGLYRYDLDKKAFDHFYHDQKSSPYTISHNIITDLALDSLGFLWIATDGGGLNIYEPATRRFQQVVSSARFPRSLNTNAIYHLMFDHIGNLWAGTFNGGVNIHKVFTSPFLIHENENEYHRIGLRSVLALQEDRAGKLWIGTDGGGLFFAQANGGSVEPHTAMAGGIPFPHSVITCLEITETDGLWVGTYAEGLSFFDTRSGAMRHFRNQPDNPGSLSHNNVWDLELDPDGGLWVATLGGGLNYLPPGETTFQRFQTNPLDPNTLSSVQIVDILLDKNGEYLWAASEDQGLNRLHIPTGEIRRYTEPHAGERSFAPTFALAGNNLQCLHQDRNGNIWIGTEFKGLNCLIPATGEVLHYDTRDGLPSNMINSIEEDGQGNLWVATQKGIIRWSPESKAILDIGTDENLRNNQYNPRASLKLKDGRLAFGGTNGFSILISGQISLNPHPPKVIFTDLMLSGQSVPIGKWNKRTVLNSDLNDPGTVVRLSYADRGIVFEFTGTDYTQPAKNWFAYQLEGFDEQWNEVGAGQHQAVYSNLKGGAYRLHVKASNNDKVWSEVQTLRIWVSPPFWKTWWFYLLCSAAVFGVAYLIVRYFLEHQKALFQERSFKAEQEILRLQNVNLEKEVETRQARLSASVLQSAHKNQFLADLKEQISKMEFPDQEPQRRELRKLIRSIDSELNQEDYWEQFRLTFDQMHQDFVQELHHRHPNISGNDNRLCYFIRMGFSNAEIASILHITVNGVEQSKYRLKKKMELDKDASLNEYIWNL